MIDTDAPNLVCPICQSSVAFATGYYDKSPRYCCRVCGHEIKQRNPVVTLLVAGGVMLILTVLTFYLGRAAANGPGTAFNFNSIFSASTPPVMRGPP